MRRKRDAILFVLSQPERLGLEILVREVPLIASRANVFRLLMANALRDLGHGEIADAIMRQDKSFSIGKGA